MGKSSSVERVGSARGSLVDRVVGGTGLDAVVGGAEEGAVEVVAVVVVALGGGVVVPVGSKLNRGSPNGKAAPLTWGVYGGVHTNSLV